MISFRLLREMMVEKGVSKYYLRNKCKDNNLDPKTIKRLFDDESVSTNTIEKLTKIFGCSINEIMEIIPDQIPGENENVG